MLSSFGERFLHANAHDSNNDDKNQIEHNEKVNVFNTLINARHVYDKMPSVQKISFIYTRYWFNEKQRKAHTP